MTQAEIEDKLTRLQQQASQLKAQENQLKAQVEQARIQWLVTAGAIEAYKEMHAAVAGAAPSAPTEG